MESELKYSPWNTLSVGKNAYDKAAEFFGINYNTSL